MHFPSQVFVRADIAPCPMGTCYLFMHMFKLSVVICNNGKWFVLQIWWFSLGKAHTFKTFFFLLLLFRFWSFWSWSRSQLCPKWTRQQKGQRSLATLAGTLIMEALTPVSWFSQKWQGQIVSKCHFNTDFHQSTELCVRKWPHVPRLAWHIENELFWTGEMHIGTIWSLC